VARWDWDEAAAETAFKRAAQGKGRQLAKLLKATSEADLADALSRHPVDLRLVVAHCAGLRDERRELNRAARQARKAMRRHRT